MLNFQPTENHKQCSQLVPNNPSELKVKSSNIQPSLKKETEQEKYDSLVPYPNHSKAGFAHKEQTFHLSTNYKQVNFLDLINFKKNSPFTNPLYFIKQNFQQLTYEAQFQKIEKPLHTDFQYLKQQLSPPVIKNEKQLLQGREKYEDIYKEYRLITPASYKGVSLNPDKYCEVRIPNSLIKNIQQDKKVTLHQNPVTAEFKNNKEKINFTPLDFPVEIWQEKDTGNYHIIGLSGDIWFNQALHILAYNQVPVKNVSSADELDVKINITQHIDKAFTKNKSYDGLIICPPSKIYPYAKRISMQSQ